MRYIKRGGIICGLVLSCLIFGRMESYAASNTITSVSISVRPDSSMKKDCAPGEPYPVTITSGSGRYEIAETEWLTAFEDWDIGETVKANVSLVLSDDGYDADYRFSSVKGRCSGGEVLSVKNTRDAVDMRISYKVGGKLLPPSEAGWDSQTDGIAVWSRVRGADEYRIKVYADGKSLASKTVKENRADLRSEIVNNSDKDITYEVQAIGRGASDDSEYAVCDETPFSGDTSFDGRVRYSESSGISARDENGKPVTGWQQVLGRWYYFNNSGNSLKDWQQINGTWYFFDESGMMLTGWQKIRNIWYYLQPSGAMLTGWMKAGPGYIWYYLDSYGGMATGWREINGVWYYFGPDGIMFYSTITPDGYIVGETGAWNLQPTV